MKKVILTSIFISTVLISHSQDTFLIGQKNFPCTPSFNFQSPSGTQVYGLDILIAKNGESGMIVLSASIMEMMGVRIKGNILIYLEDATVITCIDKGKFDVVDNTVTTVYYLTKEEIANLKKSNISKIRFSLKCYGNTVSAPGLEGNYSASNSYINIEKMGEKNETNVPDLIKKLFGE